jgi:hypothetical protein
MRANRKRGKRRKKERPRRIIGDACVALGSGSLRFRVDETILDL